MSFRQIGFCGNKKALRFRHRLNPEKPWFSDKVVVEGYRFIGLGSLVRVYNRKPGVVGKIHWDRCNCSEEEVVFSQNLFVGLRSQEVCGPFRNKYAISLIVVGF